jgi:hypothetical protein
MPLCQACDAIETNKRRAPAHDATKRTGKNYDYKPFA